jgi:hypothetical protein
MMIYDVMAVALAGNLVAFSTAITMIVAAGLCFGIVVHALDTQYDEIAHELSHLGYRALAELETARTDILKLGDKFDAVSAPGSTRGRSPLTTTEMKTAPSPAPLHLRGGA